MYFVRGGRAKKQFLRVYIGDIPLEGLAYREVLSVAWLTEVLDKRDDLTLQVIADGALVGNLTNVQGTVLFRGTLHLPLRVTCVRCLVEQLRTYEFPVQATLFAKKGAAKSAAKTRPKLKARRGKAALEVAEDAETVEDLGVGSYQAEEIDLAGLVRDELLLQLVSNPLCKGSCAGLCAICGRNLNYESCSCQS